VPPNDHSLSGFGRTLDSDENVGIDRAQQLHRSPQIEVFEATAHHGDQIVLGVSAHGGTSAALNSRFLTMVKNSFSKKPFNWASSECLLVLSGITTVALVCS
jgi:hypothetical protein